MREMRGRHEKDWKKKTRDMGGWKRLSDEAVEKLASLVSSCPPHVTMPLSSVVCHLPSFLRVLPTVVCSSPVSLSSSSALLSALVTLAIFRTQLFRTLVAFVVVVRSLPRFPFRIAMPMSNHTSARDLVLQSF